MTDDVRRPLRRPISRSTFLRAAAGTVLGAGLVTVAGGTAAAGERRAGVVARRPPTVITEEVADLTGVVKTSRFQMAATDLGIPVRAPDGGMLFIFGDSYATRPPMDADHPGDEWRSPTGLYSGTTDLNSGITWSGAVGGDTARQLWPYEHTDDMTMLPADAIVIGRTIYVYAMRNEPFPHVTETQIWKSDDNGATWQDTGVRFNDNDARFGANYQCITWGEGNDGFIYIFSTRFGRASDSKLYLSRVPTARITDVTAYEPWGWDGSSWGWGKPFSPVLSDGRFGELCLRPIDGKWVLTFLHLDDDGGGGMIEAIVMDTPTDDLTNAYRYHLIHSADWNDQSPASGWVAQPYGGYIIPGSTIAELHTTVSQWQSPDLDQDPETWVYHVMQFRSTGVGS